MGHESFVVRNSTIPFLCLPDLLEHQAKRIAHAPAILAPGRAPLTYRDLHQHVQDTRVALRRMGIGRHDPVAVVLPNGPEMATAALAVEASAACAPLNPAYRAEEFQIYFTYLRPRALIVQAGIDSTARAVALARGIPVIELSPATDGEAGHFTLNGSRGDVLSDESVSADQVAVLMLTSGTTARPKIVPQTHANICASAFSSVAALALSESDCCLNIMPLFHGHGLHSTLLASIAAGASIVCTPGLNVDRFGDWLKAFDPTWYAGVPTMHQAIVSQLEPVREHMANGQLRFVRSASASLAPRLFADLERTFEAPVIEYYAMTETTSTPIACNPMPPGRRKIGSVGIPVRLDVAIMNDEGRFANRGQTGEIVVRGNGVMAGYQDDAIGTQAAFAGDWLKTGDLGYFDDDGYLFLTGRIRETVNRGGEKISPQEVEEVLLQHPAVAEAVTFAVPHPTLGEDVGSAVVLRPQAKTTEKHIRQFAMERLAAFKVPRLVEIVGQIPKGPTGKMFRIGMATKLGIGTSASIGQASVRPRTPLEKTLAEIWSRLLGVEEVGLHDDFFALGGDSLLATRVLLRVHESTHLEVDVSSIFEAPTIAELAERIETLSQAVVYQTPAIGRVVRQNSVAATSFAQERVWELRNLLPELPFFNVLHVLRVASPCDVAILERSINEIVRRHEILRTTFAAVDGRCVQVIAPELIVAPAFDDLRALPRPNIEAAVHRIVQEELSYQFVLERSPLIRTRLVRLAERSHLLLIAMAGIITDGWSLGVLVNELATLYDAFSGEKPSPLDPLPIQYADFADWQRRWQSHPNIVAEQTYWEQQLHDPLPVMKLTSGRRRRKIDNFTTARRQLELPTKLSEDAKRFGQREGVTLFVVLMAAMKTLLHRYTGVEDLRVATDIANRNHPETERLIGPIANTVVLRTSLRGHPSAREVIRRVRATTLAALANQDIPFEAVMESLERYRGIDPAAVAQVKMSLQGPSLRPVEGAEHGLVFQELVPGMELPLVTMTTFDVSLMLRESTKGLVGTCMYKPHLFGAEVIDRLLQDFQHVLDCMVVEPERSISTIVVSSNQRS